MHLGNHSSKVARDWRCDAAAGVLAALNSYGRDNPQAQALPARQQTYGHGDSDHAAHIGRHNELLVHETVNLERKEVCI